MGIILPTQFRRKRRNAPNIGPNSIKLLNILRVVTTYRPMKLMHDNLRSFLPRNDLRSVIMLW